MYPYHSDQELDKIINYESD